MISNEDEFNGLDMKSKSFLESSFILKKTRKGSERPQCEKIKICFLIEIMANNEVEFLLRCFLGENGLDMKSKSFLCLHSLCET